MDRGEHDLSDDQCDHLVAKTMDLVAAKCGCHALELDPDIRAHHSLRRGLVRVAYELGKQYADEHGRAIVATLSWPTLPEDRRIVREEIEKGKSDVPR